MSDEADDRLAGIRPLTHTERIEHFTRLAGVERMVDAVRITVDVQGKATDRRLEAVERGLEDNRAASREEHEQQDRRSDQLLDRIAQLEKRIDDNRINARDILVATGPLAVAIIGLIGYLLSSGPQ